MDRLPAATFLILFCTTTLCGEVITVCSSGCDHTSINEAIETAQNHDVIQLSNEIYQEGEVIDTLRKSITIRGTVDDDGVPTTVIDGDDDHRILTCRRGETPLTRFENLTIINGSAERGAGIYILESSPTLSNCIFQDNHAEEDGGAIYNESDRYSLAMISTPVMSNCTFRSNTAERHGGAVYNDFSGAEIEGCVFIENESDDGHGGAMVNDRSRTVIVGSEFIENESRLNGGAIKNRECNPSLTGCIFSRNESRGGGGAIANAYSSPTITTCSFRDNEAQVGGGLWNDWSDPIVEECTFTGNFADLGGGGILNRWSNPTLIDCMISENNGVQPGGGILNQFESDSILSGCRLWCNSPDAIVGDYTEIADNCINLDCTDCADGSGEGTTCPGDLDASGEVDGRDLSLLLVEWGGPGSIGDVDGNGLVGASDLGLLFAAWGPCD